MVKNFKGEVKISDVKAEFDNLIDRINNMVDSYNISGKVEELDYTVGGVNLSPSGYTLSVGGLKQGLLSVDRNIIGAKCFKINDNKFKITDGLVLTKKGAIRLPDKVIERIPNYNTLYFNTKTNAYQWVGSSDYREETVTKEFNSCNVLNEETGLYRLVDPETGYTLDAGFTDSYDPQFTNLMRYNAMDEIIYNSPRDITDQESIVEKIKMDISRYQWIPLNNPEVTLKDIVFEVEAGEGVFTPRQLACSGVLLGKYEYNDNGSGFNTFDPRLGIYFGASWTSTLYDKQNTFGIVDYTNKSTERFFNRYYPSTSLNFNGQTSITEWITDNELPTIYPDIDSIKITFEEHNDRFMMVMKWNLRTIRYDHYVGDLYNSEGMKRDYDSIYTIKFFSNEYKDLKVGNTGILSRGYNNYGSVYDFRERFRPDLYTLNGSKPVTDKANIYYTILVPIGESEEVYRVCDININRDSKFLNDINTIQTEGFNGKYKITSESKTFGGSGTLRYSNVSRNAKDAIFISGIDAERFEREGTSSVVLLGDTVAWNYQTGHRNLNYWTPVNMFYIPKGINNPFAIYNGDASKSFKVIVEKKVE